MSYATRIANLKPEGAYQVLARANQLEAEGREIIHLEIGQPDYATFENVSEAGIAANSSRSYPLHTALRNAVFPRSNRRG